MLCYVLCSVFIHICWCLVVHSRHTRLDLTRLPRRKRERERETGCYYYADDFGPAPARLSLSPYCHTLCQTSMHQHTSPRGLVVNAHLYARTQVFGKRDSIFDYYPKLQRRKVLAHAEGKEIQNQTGENGEIKIYALKWRGKKIPKKQNWNRSGSCLVVCVFFLEGTGSKISQLRSVRYVKSNRIAQRQRGFRDSSHGTQNLTTHTTNIEKEVGKTEIYARVQRELWPKEQQ